MGLCNNTIEIVNPSLEIEGVLILYVANSLELDIKRGSIGLRVLLPVNYGTIKLIQLFTDANNGQLRVELNCEHSAFKYIVQGMYMNESAEICFDGDSYVSLSLKGS